MCHPIPLPAAKGHDGVGVPLLPKLRGYFAEFLNHSSLVRLGILYLTTCVGLGYGPCAHSLEAFLGSIGSPNSPHSAMHHLSDVHETRICLGLVLPACPSITTDWYGYLPASPHRLPTTGSGRALRLGRPEGLTRFRALSITRFGRGATTPVREYQPVVHRLRLSASP